MRIVYCMCSVYNPGGMERVLLNKVEWLRKHTPWEVTVVTTDQQGREPFYPFPEGVRMVDLGINYSADNGKGAFGKIAGYLRKRRKHRKRLEALLKELKPDVTVSLFPSESGFLPDLTDGSRKVLELHFCKMFRLQYGRMGLLGLIDRWRSKQDEKLVRKFDRFVVLTEEDKELWGEMENIRVIPNAAVASELPAASTEAKRVIAAGRLDYQKGFDRLLEAWAIAKKDERATDWQLDIFGQGEWREKLVNQAKELGIADSAHINAPTKRIEEEWRRSGIHAMSSHYEGLPMVMIEAMAAGLPEVTMDFQCGPRDIIRHGENGLMVKEGDTQAMAEALLELMLDPEKRRRMGQEAQKVKEQFSEERIMAQWVKLFKELE